MRSMFYRCPRIEAPCRDSLLFYCSSLTKVDSLDASSTFWCNVGLKCDVMICLQLWTAALILSFLSHERERVQHSIDTEEKAPTYCNFCFMAFSKITEYFVHWLRLSGSCHENNYWGSCLETVHYNSVLHHYVIRYKSTEEILYIRKTCPTYHNVTMRYFQHGNIQTSIWWKPESKLTCVMFTCT